MDLRTSAQDVMLCDMCETTVVHIHCETCLINLCTACVGEHMISDEFKDHKVVKYQSRKSTPLYPGCTTHYKERCEMYCNQCDIPICSACIASETHTGHKILQILPVYYDKKKEIETENEELKERICPTYQDIASGLQNRMSQSEKKYGDLSTAITKHGEYWHRKIDRLVMKLKDKVNEMKATHHSVLKYHIAVINQRISDIEDEIQAFSKLQESNDISQVFQFQRKTTEFKKLPCKVDVSVPCFTPLLCQQEQFINLFGNLSTLSISSEEYGYNMKTSQESPEAGSSAKVKQLLDQPKIVATVGIHTRFGQLYDVACLNNNAVWTSGTDSTIKLFNIIYQDLSVSITTKSGNWPFDIAVTKNGNLVYTDCRVRAVNIVKNEKIEDIIILQNWKPLGVCSTSSDELLVCMYSDDYKKSKVVRYSGSTEKQTIQFDDKGKPLYSSGPYHKYITENRNLGICVADIGAEAVVVVNQAGKLRFRYTLHTPAPKSKPFNPRGITTDSQSHILTADYNNDCVHIIDQYGLLISYINCGLSKPFGLCVDKNDDVFVVDSGNIQLKKVKYMQ